MSGVHLEARGVSRIRGGTTLLDRVSFRLHPGEVLALIGPSGAGKSTLIDCLNGREAPDRGFVFYGGQDLYDSRTERPVIGHVPQSDIVHRALTPRLCLDYAVRLRQPHLADEVGEKEVARILEVLELTERADVRVRSLSGGQVKRVNVGVELVGSPPIMFLDEPTSGLDPAMERKTMELLARLARDGRTLLVTTHVMDSLDLTDAVAVLVRGRLAYFGPAAGIRAYFSVETPADLFTRLKERPADEWGAAFASSDQARWAMDRPAPVTRGRPVGDGEHPVPERPASPGPVAGAVNEDELLEQLRAEIRREQGV